MEELQKEISELKDLLEVNEQGFYLYKLKKIEKLLIKELEKNENSSKTIDYKVE